MRTLPQSDLKTARRVEHHLDFDTWRLAHFVHDFVWLPKQIGPVMRITHDGDYLKKRGLAPGTMVDIAVPFTLLPLDYQMKNIRFAIDILVYREYWWLKNPNGTEEEFAESNAVRQHLASLNQTSGATEFKKPYNQLSEEQRELNRAAGRSVQLLADPSIFIGGTVGGNKTGHATVEALRKIFKEHQLIHANLPKGASWHAVPRMYEEAAKRSADVLIYIFGTPSPIPTFAVETETDPPSIATRGQLSTYTPLEIQHLIDTMPDRLIVLFDYNGLDERPRDVLIKLQQDDWHGLNAFAAFSPQDAVRETQIILSERGLVSL